jgi:hypothetical protein
LRRSERLFLAVSPLPPLAWLAASAYLDGLDGWGKWAAGPALLGPVLLASLILGLLGVFLSLRARSDRAALLRLGAATVLAGSIALMIGCREIYSAITTDHRRFDPQPYLDAARQAEQSAQRFRNSVHIGRVSAQLSCQATKAYIPAEYGPAYERAHFAIPLEISEPGRYRIRLGYSSDLNPKRHDLRAEQVLDLDGGSHEVVFVYTFARNWGYFVEAPGSTLEIRLDRYVSLGDIHGDSATLLDENIERKTFRNVTFETRRLEGLANVYTDTLESLVCPEQPSGPPPPEDGPR